MRLVALPILLAAALPAADSRIASSMNAFTTETYRQVAHGDANLVLSPYNIATALSMALAGARGQTAREIESVLQVHSDASYDAALAALAAELGKAGNSGENQLLTANGLWVQKGLALRPAFEKTLTEHYGAAPRLVDFMGHAEDVRAQINRWTEEQTKEKIKDLFPPGSLEADTRLALTSAIYFYGAWQSPFETSRTQPAPFTPLGGKAVETRFMNQTAHFGYAETPAAQVLEMTYRGTGFAFDVLLPKAAAGLPDLEKSLTAENLTGWLGSLTSRNVQVSLPKFRAESEFSLARTLSQMGMASAFTDAADFSGIRAEGKLAISQVVHKAFVDVAERGTEAAAATGMAIRVAAARMPERPVVFRADHPFLFLIRDTKSGTVLFIGRLMTPR